MQIDDKLISYLEDLSCLSLSDNEKIRLKSDLQKILDYIASLGKLDTSGVSGRSHPFDNVNVFREDKVCASFDRDLIIRNAPVKKDGMILAPGAIV